MMVGRDERPATKEHVSKTDGQGLMDGSRSPAYGLGDDLQRAMDSAVRLMGILLILTAPATAIAIALFLRTL